MPGSGVKTRQDTFLFPANVSVIERNLQRSHGDDVNSSFWPINIHWYSLAAVIQSFLKLHPPFGLWALKGLIFALRARFFRSF